MKIWGGIRSRENATKQLNKAANPTNSVLLNTQPSHTTTNYPARNTRQKQETNAHKRGPAGVTGRASGAAVDRREAAANAERTLERALRRRKLAVGALLACGGALEWRQQAQNTHADTITQ